MADNNRPTPTWWTAEEIDDGQGGTTLKYHEAKVWHFDQIIADNNPDLTATKFFIFNNKGGDTARNKMTDCKLTSKDGTYGTFRAGQMESPLVQGKWVQVKCKRTGVNDWKPIGANLSGGIATQEDIPIGAVGSEKTAEELGVPHAGTQEICGYVNDGTFDSEVSKECYAEVDARIAVPADAEAGNVKFLLRVYYNIMA